MGRGFARGSTHVAALLHLQKQKDDHLCADNGANRDRLIDNRRSPIHLQVVFAIAAGHDFQPMVMTLWRQTSLLLLLLNAFLLLTQLTIEISYAIRLTVIVSLVKWLTITISHVIPCGRYWT